MSGDSFGTSYTACRVRTALHCRSTARSRTSHYLLGIYHSALSWVHAAYVAAHAARAAAEPRARAAGEPVRGVLTRFTRASGSSCSDRQSRAHYEGARSLALFLLRQLRHDSLARQVKHDLRVGADSTPEQLLDLRLVPQVLLVEARAAAANCSSTRAVLLIFAGLPSCSPTAVLALSGLILLASKLSDKRAAAHRVNVQAHLRLVSVRIQQRERYVFFSQITTSLAGYCPRPSCLIFAVTY